MNPPPHSGGRKSLQPWAGVGGCFEVDWSQEGGHATPPVPPLVGCSAFCCSEQPPSPPPSCLCYRTGVWSGSLGHSPHPLGSPNSGPPRPGADIRERGRENTLAEAGGLKGEVYFMQLTPTASGRVLGQGLRRETALPSPSPLPPWAGGQLIHNFPWCCQASEPPARGWTEVSESRQAQTRRLSSGIGWGPQRKAHLGATTAACRGNRRRGPTSRGLQPSTEIHTCVRITISLWEPQEGKPLGQLSRPLLASRTRGQPWL